MRLSTQRTIDASVVVTLMAPYIVQLAGKVSPHASDLRKECHCLGGCPTGEARITRAYKLPSRFVIHTVGPVGEDAEALASAYRSSLEKAIQV